MAEAGRERVNQKTRTRRAIVEACQELTTAGRAVTMPEVAAAALVSEATAYRYFPDLASLLSEALVSAWPSPAEALAPVAASADLVERVEFAARVLLEGVAWRQAAVRAMIAATIGHPDLAGAARPGFRFGLIDYAIEPFAAGLAAADAGLPEQLRRGLAIVISSEALFVLTDLCGLSVGEAIDSAVLTASTIAAAAASRLS
ncbi:MAG TPA: TetR/AcrR family transcriptional regulator [Acidimicrobiales bacterium]|nr:TetR/AcrR family transcriptional regulator [Acidimicrobiales bacterium]